MDDTQNQNPAAEMLDPVIDVGEAQGFPVGPDSESESEVFGAEIHPIGRAIGMRALGAMYVVVEPGKRAFPFHSHYGNEEMFVILEGTGVYRFGEAEHVVAEGCVCAAPAGGAETAHQLINTGATQLKYLAISTMNDPDVCEYPDSGKLATIAIGPGRDFNNARVKQINRSGETLDYWDGEDI